MRRALHAVFLLSLVAGVAWADDAPFVPPTAGVQLSGGASARDTEFPRDTGLGQLRPSELVGVSPFYFRLDANWYFWRFLGVEIDGSGDAFTATGREGRFNANRWAGRAAVAFRWSTKGGFTVGGAFGYGVSLAPTIYFPSATPVLRLLSTHGPTGRFGIGFTKDRFDGALNVTALLPVGGDGRVFTLEPRLWLGVRLFDVGPTGWWLGGDVSGLIENSQAYGGFTFRFALGLRVTLGTPREAGTPIDPDQDPTNPGTWRVRVTLPDGAVARGAQVAIDDGAALAVDEAGELRVAPNPGAHSVKVTLAGHRAATVSATVRANEETVTEVQLVALTGPGRLSGVVRAAVDNKPVADALVNVAEQSTRTDASGAYVFAKVGPGPVQVRVDAQGFNLSEEAVQVPPEGVATLDFALEPLGKGSPATVRGLVRSRSGDAIKATVVVRGLKQKVAVTPEGRFVLTVPAGEYTFVISAPGHVAQTKKVTLGDGEQAIFHCELLKVSR